MTTSAQPTMRYRIDTVLAHGPAVKEFRLAPADGSAAPGTRRTVPISMR